MKLSSHTVDGAPGLVVWIAAALMWSALAAFGQTADVTRSVSPPRPAPVATNFTGPLDLARAQQIALAGNPSIAEAEARVRQAHDRLRIAQASFLPTVGLRGSWTKSDLPERLFQSDLPTADEARADWNAATRGWQPGDTLERYLNHPLSDLGPAWSNGDLIPYLRDAAHSSPSPVVPQADLRRLLDYLQSRQRLGEADAEDIADALRTSYLEATVGDNPTTYRVGAQASWMVFDGFSRMFRRAAALHGEKKTQAARRDAERLLRGGVAAAYYQAQYAREEVGIARSDLEFSARLLKDATHAREAGLRGADDVLDFEVKRTASEAQLLEAQRTFQLSLHALSAVLALPGAGLPENAELVPLSTESAANQPVPDVEQEVAYALTHRPDLEAARFTVAARRAELGLARSTFYPSVWLVSGYDALRQENINFEQDDFGWNISVIASVDLFRGGARLASVSERTAAQAATEAEEYKDELEAIKEVRDGLATYASAGDQLRLQTAGLAQVQRFRDFVEMEYKSGTVPALKLHDAQHKLVSAQRRQASALIARHAAWHALQQATARSLTAAQDSR